MTPWGHVQLMLALITSRWLLVALICALLGACATQRLELLARIAYERLRDGGRPRNPTLCGSA